VPDLGTFLVLGPENFHDVKAAGAFEQPMRFQESQGGAGQSRLAVGVDRFSGPTVLRAAASFDLDKYHRPTVDGNNIDFAVASSMSPGNDAITEPSQMSGRLPFALFAERGGRKSASQPLSHGHKRLL